jgi:hypothetical protein
MYIADINCRICQYLDISSIRSYKSASADLNHMLKNILTADEYAQTVVGKNVEITISYNQYKFLAGDDFGPISLKITIKSPTYYGDFKYKTIFGWYLIIYYNYYNTGATVCIYMRADGKAKYILTGYIMAYVEVYSSSTYMDAAELLVAYIDDDLGRCSAIENKLRGESIIDIFQYFDSIIETKWCADLIPRA